jgi:hypothetical protein
MKDKDIRDSELISLIDAFKKRLLISVKLYLEVELGSLNRTCSHYVYLLAGTSVFDCTRGLLAVRWWIGSFFASGRVIRYCLPVSRITLHS